MPLYNYTGLLIDVPLVIHLLVIKTIDNIHGTGLET